MDGGNQGKQPRRGMMPASDEELMQRVQQGLHQHFAELVGRHQQSLFRYAQARLGSYALAEDAVQETFLAAFAHRDGYDQCRPFKPWLWTIAVNQCRKCLRHASRRREERFDDPVELAASPQADPVQVVMAAERVQQRAQLLARLPAEQAEALDLRFFGRLQFDEIASSTGVSVATAKSRVRYALEKLSQWITQSTVEEWSSDT